jgi:hypothetical protein
METLNEKTNRRNTRMYEIRQSERKRKIEK